MAVHSKLYEILPEHYGYVIFTGVGSTFVNMWMAMNVSRARKRLSVEYPTMYSPDNKEFNCIQRAHQHSLEGHPTFLMFLFIGGLQYPKISAAVGHIYILSKIAFALGYYTGEPAKRKWGAFGHFALIALMGNTLSFATHQLGWFK